MSLYPSPGWLSPPLLYAVGSKISEEQEQFSVFTSLRVTPL